MAAAIQIFFYQKRRRGRRLSNYWHDLAHLSALSFAENALADRVLALSVSCRTVVFVPENDSNGDRLDYEAVESVSLQLLPTGIAHSVLADDYASIIAGGMLLDVSEPFETLMERCALIEAKAGTPRSGGSRWTCQWLQETANK